jgi:hypothetical protein
VGLCLGGRHNQKGGQDHRERTPDNSHLNPP